MARCLPSTGETRDDRVAGHCLRGGDVRYDAFISYSHAADDALAPAVQRGLQTLARRWNRRRALEVFRDQTGLSVSPGLWSSIKAGLDESEFFVLLASPEAAASTWVNQEIEHWAASHSVERMLPVLTDGEWVWSTNRGDFDWDASTAVPAALRGLFREEPRHLDLRWARAETELDLRHSRFREAVAQLAAPMHGMSPQDLESSDVARYRHLVRLRRTVVAVLCVLLLLVSGAGLLAVRNAREARQQKDAARHQQALAEKQATRALSLQLLAQAKVAGARQRSLSLLLTAAAARLAPSEAFGTVISELEETAGLMKVYDLPVPVRAKDVSAIDVDHGLYAVVHHGTLQPSVGLWNLDTGQKIGPDDPVVHSALPLQDDRFYGYTVKQMAFGRSGTLAVRYRCQIRLCATANGHGAGTPTSRRGQFGGIELFDVRTGGHRVLKGSTPASTFAFDHGGDRLASSTADGRVDVWDVNGTGGPPTRLSPSSPGRPTSLAFSSDDERIALGERDPSRLLVWTVLPAARPHPLTIAVHPAPRQVTVGHAVLAIRDAGGGVRLWRVRNGRPLGPIPDARAVVSIASGPGGTLATADARGVFRVWNVPSGQQVGRPTPAGSRGSGVQLVFDPRGRLVSTGSDIRVWKISRWNLMGRDLYHHTAPVTALAVSRDGTLASADTAGVITVAKSASTRSPTLTIRPGGGAVTALAFSSQGILAAGGQDGAVRLLDAASGKPIGRAIRGHDGRVSSLAFRPDGSLLAIGYEKSSATAWHRLAPVHIFRLHGSPRLRALPAGQVGGAASVAFGAGDAFAAAGDDFLAIWDEKTWLSRVLGADKAGPYTAVAFSSDGSELASSARSFAPADDRPLALWTRLSSDPRMALVSAGRAAGTDRAFDSLAFSPDDSLLAGAGHGGVQLWDVTSQQPLGGRLGSPASSVAVSPDGRYVLVGDDRGAVRSYPATVGGWVDDLCAIVSRNLTRPEWRTYVGSHTPYQPQCPQYRTR
jgi:WD40 repeat protein